MNPKIYIYSFNVPLRFDYQVLFLNMNGRVICDWKANGGRLSVTNK